MTRIFSKIGIICVCFFSLCGLLSCGIDVIYYIDYIPQGRYDDTFASIDLPSSSADGYSIYFTRFIIFYRIYISGVDVSGTIQTDAHRREINSMLDSDWISLYPLTDITSTSVSTFGLENTFSNRGYFVMALEDENINSVLDDKSLGKTLEFAFPPTGERPAITIGGRSYVLQRAVTGQKSNLTIDFIPAPDRYFLNHSDLCDAAKIINTINPDVAPNTGSTLQYTYVSLYIAAAGKSLEMPPTVVYSQPAFVGIFKLANRL